MRSNQPVLVVEVIKENTPYFFEDRAEDVEFYIENAIGLGWIPYMYNVRYEPFRITYFTDDEDDKMTMITWEKRDPDLPYYSW